jgi:hypothetical protein
VDVLDDNLEAVEASSFWRRYFFRREVATQVLVDAIPSEAAKKRKDV